MTGDDPRPAVWVGHVTLPTPDLPATWDFMLAVGMREIFRSDEVGVLELRGGTHLVLLPAEQPASGDAYFDLMVEDLDAAHADLAAKGLAPTSIERGDIHDSFRVASPSGHTIRFNSTHVSDLPV